MGRAIKEIVTRINMILVSYLRRFHLCAMGVAMSSQSKPANPSGLRSFKKLKTRRDIEAAAAALFKKHGYESTTVEQIAQRAKVSKPTFFRYFRSKADILLAKHSEQLPAVRDAIISRPANENDLVAVRAAFLREDIEMDRSVRLALAVATTSIEEFSFDNISMKVTRDWLAVIGGALAQRRGLDKPTEACLLSARAISAVLLNAVDCWISDGCREDLTKAVARNFDEMTRLHDEWRSPQKSLRVAVKKSKC
jgi:AcrR family transcriptional regulator